VFIAQSAFAQQPLYTNYQRFDVEDGMPMNLVTGIVQDDDGFLWISTFDGLTRYDGKHFITFRHKTDDSTTLLSNRINRIWKGPRNKLWIGYHSKSDSFDLSFEAFDPQALQVSGADSRNIPLPYYSLQSGYEAAGFRSRYSLMNHLFDQRRTFIGSMLTDVTSSKLKTFLQSMRDTGKKFTAFAPDDKGRMWVATETGLEFSDTTWNNFHPILFPVAFHYDAEKMKEALLLHLHGHRVAIFLDDRLTIYNNAKATVMEIEPDSIRDVPLTTIDGQGRVLFTRLGSVYRLEDNDRVRLLWRYPGKQGLRCIFVDRTNTLWVGTDSDGLYKIDLLTPAFTSRAYEDDFLSDVLSREIGITRKIGRDEITPAANYYASYAYAADGSLLININDSGVLYEGIGSTVLRITDKSAESIHHDKLNGLLVADREKKTWYFGYSGLLYEWSDPDKNPLIYSSQFPSPAAGQMVDALADSGCYWAITQDRGLYRFDKNKTLAVIRSFDEYGGSVIINDPDDSNFLWVGTLSGGLFKWNKEQGRVIAAFTTANGLPNNTINTIVADSLGYFWISTNKGITRFNRKREIFTTYSRRDGLIESEFNRHHEIVLPDGRIAMGGTSGYSVFSPRDFTEDPYSPEVFVTSVWVNDKQVIVRPQEKGLLDGPLNTLRHVSVSHDENTIWFEVAATQFNSPEKTKYRYKLEGYDRDWIDSEGDRRIRFNRLPFGNYTLLVNASNTSGVWSPAILKISVTVNPPLWRTWWAYAVYVIVLALCVRMYWQAYKRRVRLKEETLFNIREAARLREVDEMKTRFFSNITHEFRTPITLILTPLEKYLKDDTMPAKAKILLNNNYRHASQLLELVNHLLDIAKIEAGRMSVNPTAGELSLFAQQYADAFRGAAAKKEIDLYFSTEGIDGHYLFDHEKWNRIIQNLLSNAIKFTNRGGSVYFSLTADDTTGDDPFVNIQVRDTGVGIGGTHLSRIFDRFYQADDSSTRNHEGTGIGLSLVKELAELMNGTVSVNSDIDKGSTFIVRIPVKKIADVPAAMAVELINDFREGRSVVPGIDHNVPVILVVEDNDELRSFISESLSATWKTLEASNGQDAWTIIGRELPEIVISDVMMPGMNGFELCKKVKSDPRTAHIGFIMLTARTAQESKIEGLESGADEYVIKPFHLYELELRITNLLQEQESVRLHMQEKLLPAKPDARPPQITDPFLVSLQRFLHENLENSQLNADKVAYAMAMSKSTLNRKLGALLNVSINEYIRHFRLQQAVSLLSSGHSVSEVSHRVGFETASYFATCFKEHYHQTPSDYSRAAS
jgi:signal transduction histidine kinase/DNA-binding response OmpR family regulator